MLLRSNFKLSHILSPATIKMLRKHYIVDATDVDDSVIAKTLDKIVKQCTYELRETHHHLDNFRVDYDKTALILQVWREYIIEQIDAGYTTNDIAIQTGRDLEFINLLRVGNKQSLQNSKYVL